MCALWIRIDKGPSVWKCCQHMFISIRSLGAFNDLDCNFNFNFSMWIPNCQILSTPHIHRDLHTRATHEDHLQSCRERQREKKWYKERERVRDRGREPVEDREWNPVYKKCIEVSLLCGLWEAGWKGSNASTVITSDYQWSRVLTNIFE